MTAWRESGLRPGTTALRLAEDPFIVGGGIGAIYAVTVLGIGPDGPVARTPFFLFKSTGVPAPGDLDLLIASGLREEGG